MDFATLFSFSGRIPRSTYWLGSLALSVGSAVCAGLAVFAIHSAGPIGAILFLPILGAVIGGFALAAKRLHDRDKSAWWILVFYFVPGILDQAARASGDLGIVFWAGSFAISIWALIELGFLKGTDGTNRYGPDPLGGFARA